MHCYQGTNNLDGVRKVRTTMKHLDMENKTNTVVS